MNSPYPPQAEQQCGNCFYVKSFPVEADDFEMLWCRRNAPVPLAGGIPNHFASWPLVCGDQWCGEWAPPQEVSE